jgi:hypothetical protein
MASETAVLSNTETVREYTRRVSNERNPDLASEYLAPKVQWHGGLLGSIEGLENLTELLCGFFGALPDPEAAEQDVVAAGDTVAVRAAILHQVGAYTPPWLLGRQAEEVPDGVAQMPIAVFACMVTGQGSVGPALRSSR